MTVKELINILEKCDQNAEIMIRYYEMYDPFNSRDGYINAIYKTDFSTDNEVILSVDNEFGEDYEKQIF